MNLRTQTPSGQGKVSVNTESSCDAGTESLNDLYLALGLDMLPTLLYKYTMVKFVTFNTETPHLNKCGPHLERNLSLSCKEMY